MAGLPYDCLPGEPDNLLDDFGLSGFWFFFKSKTLLVSLLQAVGFDLVICDGQSKSSLKSVCALAQTQCLAH